MEKKILEQENQRLRKENYKLRRDLFEEKIDKFDRGAIEVLVNILVSMGTTAIVCIALTKIIGQ